MFVIAILTVAALTIILFNEITIWSRGTRGNLVENWQSREIWRYDDEIDDRGGSFESNFGDRISEDEAQRRARDYEERLRLMRQAAVGVDA